MLPTRGGNLKLIKKLNQFSRHAAYPRAHVGSLTHRKTRPVRTGVQWDLGDLDAASGRCRRISGRLPWCCSGHFRGGRGCRSSMAQGRGRAELAMLFEILVQIPLLVMSEIAWWFRAAAALACLLVLFAVAAAAIAFCVRRTAERRNLAQDGHEGPLAPAYSHRGTPVRMVYAVAAPATRRGR